MNTCTSDLKWMFVNLLKDFIFPELTTHLEIKLNVYSPCIHDSSGSTLRTLRTNLTIRMLTQNAVISIVISSCMLRLIEDCFVILIDKKAKSLILPQTVSFLVFFSQCNFLLDKQYSSHLSGYKVSQCTRIYQKSHYINYNFIQFLRIIT